MSTKSSGKKKTARSAHCPDTFAKELEQKRAKAKGGALVTWVSRTGS